MSLLFGFEPVERIRLAVNRNMGIVVRGFRVCLVLIACMVFAGCASVQNSPAQGKPKRTAVTANQLIAQDFVNVFVQLKELPASTTTLVFSAGQILNDPFLAELKEQLLQSGYGVRIVDAEPSGQAVSYTRKPLAESTQRPVHTYTLTVGSVSARRSYERLDNRVDKFDNHVNVGIDNSNSNGVLPDSQQHNGLVRPIAAMQLRGVDASAVKARDEIFRRVAPESANQPTKAGANLIASDTEQLNSLPGPDAASQASNAGRVIKAGGRTMTGSERYSVANVENVRELGHSNYAEVFRDLSIVMETVLVFDNDSTELDKENTYKLREYVASFKPESDLFSVIGCSNGPSATKQGPEQLALGRAQAVKQALMQFGVAEAYVMDEGCWAGEYYDEVMPRRGVVLSLQRDMG